jgi:hypothetical protein
VEKSIFAGSKPTDLDINVEGTELFVSDFGATQITVVNLDSREVARTLTVQTKVATWDGNPYRLACMAGDTLVFSSQDQWQDLKLVNAMTGASLGAVGTVYSPSLVASRDGTHLYVGADELTRWDIVNGMLQQVDTSGLDMGGGLVSVSADGMYVFAGSRKYLATNLKSVLGTFGETVLLSNRDGSVVIGAKAVYDGNTFAILHTLPLSTSIMALSPDDAVVYLYDTMSSRIYLYHLK